MKAFIFFFFLSFSTYAQNFMMHMNVREVMDDTVYTYNETKVIWGMRQDTLGFLWENHYPIYFIKKPYYKGNSRSTKKLIKKYIDILHNEKIEDKVILRNIFYNQWGELYLITIYSIPGIMIYITCLDSKFPHYAFLMVT